MDVKNQLWAIESVKDMVSGCLLNIILKDKGQCEKYLYEMTEDDVKDYFKLLLKISKKKKSLSL